MHVAGGCPQVFLKFLIAMLLWSTLGTAYGAVRSEYEVKAAFLYNFTRFITWSEPSEEMTGLTICVFGRNPFGDVLQQLNGRVSQGRALKLDFPASLQEIDRCQVLFVGADKARALAEITDFAHARQILTISEIPDFVEEGESSATSRKATLFALRSICWRPRNLGSRSTPACWNSP